MPESGIPTDYEIYYIEIEQILSYDMTMYVIHNVSNGM